MGKILTLDDLSSTVDTDLLTVILKAEGGVCKITLRQLYFSEDSWIKQFITVDTEVSELLRNETMLRTLAACIVQVNDKPTIDVLGEDFCERYGLDRDLLLATSYSAYPEALKIRIATALAEKLNKVPAGCIELLYTKYAAWSNIKPPVELAMLEEDEDD